jgi:DNA (cytosine-5)-methyltransferase 1
LLHRLDFGAGEFYTLSTMGRPTAIDFFCGAGGLSLGLKQAGFRVLAAVDNDPLAVKSFKANHRKTQVITADLRDVVASSLRRELRLERGALDLLAGCPPCQSFSALKTLNGRKRVRDKKSKDLLFQILRFVRELRPKAVMLENVPRLSKDPRIRVLARKLNQLGYNCERRVLNAADYGVPQRRKRMILIALRKRLGQPTFAVPSNQRRTVRQVISTLRPPRLSSDPLHGFGEKRSDEVRALIARIPADGGGRSSLPRDEQLACHKRCDGFSDIYGRMAWDAVAPTITSGCVNPSKGRFLHPRANRCITLREAALLQGFPATYKFSLEKGKFAAARLIGNALPPPFIRRHSLVIKAAVRSWQISGQPDA